MTGTLLERYLLLLAGRLPADECGVLVTEAAGDDLDVTDCFC